MCGGGNGNGLLKLAAIAAAVYTAGTAAGVFGEVAGAAETTGAVAGSEALANGVGAAGGDALGSLIASNATNWGINVAPEIAALGGSAAELSALSQATSGSKAAGVAAAAPAGESKASSVFGALKAGAQLAPLASLATMLGGNPKMAAQGTPMSTPSTPPETQAARIPAVNIFKKKLQGIDPTKLSGVSGVSDLTLGKATILGS